MRTDLQTIKKYRYYLLGVSVHLLYAHLILQFPNPNNPLKEDLEAYYLLYLIGTFLFLRLFTYAVSKVEAKKENIGWVKKSVVNSHLYSLQPILVFSFFLIILLAIVVIPYRSSLTRSGYLKIEFPLIIFCFFLNRYYIIKYPDLGKWPVPMEKEVRKGFTLLELRYKQKTLLISTRDIVLMVFQTTKCLVVCKEGRLLYVKRLSMPSFFKLDGSDDFVRYNRSGIVKKEWIEGFTGGKEPYLTLKAPMQKHIRHLLAEGDKLRGKAYDQDVLRPKKLKVNDSFKVYIKSINKSSVGS